MSAHDAIHSPAGTTDPAATAKTDGSPRTHRSAGLPVVSLAAAAVVVVGIAVFAALPDLRSGAGPAETSQSAAVSSAPADARTVRVGSVLVQYGDPPGWHVRLETGVRVAGFDDLAANRPRPLTYGWDGVQVEPDARGIVVADLTGVEFHTNGQPPLARNAAEFFDNLVQVNMGTPAEPSYAVGAVRATELAGWPALTARVDANTGYAIFEGGGAGGHLALSLDHAQRVIVADVGRSIVLVQIWATDEDALARWLPRAEALLSRLTLAPAN